MKSIVNYSPRTNCVISLTLKEDNHFKMLGIVRRSVLFVFATAISLAALPSIGQAASSPPITGNLKELVENLYPWIKFYLRQGGNYVEQLEADGDLTPKFIKEVVKMNLRLHDQGI